MTVHIEAKYYPQLTAREAGRRLLDGKHIALLGYQGIDLHRHVVFALLNNFPYDGIFVARVKSSQNDSALIEGASEATLDSFALLLIQDSPAARRNVARVAGAFGIPVDHNLAPMREPCALQVLTAVRPGSKPITVAMLCEPTLGEFTDELRRGCDGMLHCLEAAAEERATYSNYPLTKPERAG